MTTRYMVSLPDGLRTNDLEFPAAKDRVRDQARKYGLDRNRRMRVKVRGKGEYSQWSKELDTTLDRWQHLVKTSDNGDVVQLDIEAYPYTIGTRLLNVEPPSVQTEGNSDIDEIFTWLVRNFQGRNGGICNRRFIGGTTTWTQHSPWPDPDPGSNAVDWFASPDTMDELYDQMFELVRQKLPIGLVLVGSKAWTPGFTWHLSSAEYHRHGHIQGRRERSGSPRGSC